MTCVWECVWECVGVCVEVCVGVCVCPFNKSWCVLAFFGKLLEHCVLIIIILGSYPNFGSFQVLLV